MIFTLCKHCNREYHSFRLNSVCPHCHHHSLRDGLIWPWVLGVIALSILMYLGVK